jgi:hypothetical protein
VAALGIGKASATKLTDKDIDIAQFIVENYSQKL